MKTNPPYIVLPKNNWYRLINHGPLVLITSGHQRNANIAPVAWTTPVSNDPPSAAIVLYRGHHTTALIRKTGTFVINVPEVGMLKAVRYTGSVSGRKEDKRARCGLALAPGRKVKTPHVDGAAGYVECRVEKTVTIHDEVIFIGRVLGAFVRKGLFTGGTLSPRAKTFHHMGGGVFALTGRRV